MPEIGHDTGLSVGSGIGQQIGDFEGGTESGRLYYDFDGINDFIRIPPVTIASTDVISFDLLATANPAAASTIFDGSGVKVLVGTGGVVTATGGSILPATLDTSGEFIKYTFTASLAGTIDTIGCDTDGRTNLNSIPIQNFDVRAASENRFYPIDDGWPVNPQIRNAAQRHDNPINGTFTYDNSTQTFFDYSTQVDPKYGDVASTEAEAQARAKEGIVVNGDFRDGTITGWTQNGGATISHQSGALRVVSTGNSGAYMDIPCTAGVEYTISVDAVESVAQARLTVYDGASFGVPILSTFNRLVIINVFRITPTTTTMRFYLNNTGAAGSCDYSNIQCAPSTVQVVNYHTLNNGVADDFDEVNWIAPVEPTPGTAQWIDTNAWIDTDTWID